MSDQFDNWRKRLAGEKVPTYETEPDPGYYRQAIQTKDPKTGVRKTVGWTPVAIFIHEGEPCAMAGRGDDRAFVGKAELIERLWLWVVKHPITEELYFAVAERGERWPDLPEPIAQPSRDIISHPDNGMVEDRANDEVPAGIGHNQPPATDPLAEMREQIENAAGAVKGLKVTTQEEAQLAQSSRARLNELGNSADRHREAEKAPHLKAGRDVDAKYMPLVNLAKGAAETVRKEIERFLTEERRKAAAAELQRQKDEEARKAAEAAAARRPAAGEDLPPPPPPPPPLPPPVAPPPSTIKGAIGKAATVGTIKVAVIKNWSSTLNHYAADADLQALVQKLANRDANAGLHVPGAEIEEQAKLK